jgi:hypothetical protein
MTDDRLDSSDRAPPGATAREAMEGAVGKITTGIVIAGAIVGLAVYARPGPPRYQAFADGDRIVRIDTRKGSIIACEGQQTCQLILRSGQRLTRVKRTDAPAGLNALPNPAPARTLPAAPAEGK